MPSDTRQQYCSEINSLGVRCSHRATNGDKCAFHDPRRKRCAAFKDDGTRCIRGPMIGMRTCASHAGYSGKLAKDDPIPFAEDPAFDPFAKELDESTFLLEITDAEQFARAVLDSRDFREYIFYGIRKRDISPTVLLRLMDYGWGKPPDKVEHTGKDGKPIETVTMVRRVVVRMPTTDENDGTIEEVLEEQEPNKYSTH